MLPNFVSQIGYLALSKTLAVQKTHLALIRNLKVQRKFFKSFIICIAVYLIRNLFGRFICTERSKKNPLHFNILPLLENNYLLTFYV